MPVEYEASVAIEDVVLDAGAEIYTPEITTDDYSALANKPSINGVVLIGDKSSHDLHLADLDDIYNFYPTDTAQGAVASFPDGAESVPVKSLSVTIEPVQSGTGDPSPSNVRPISGHSTAVVTRTGINIWDEEWESGYINTSTGQNEANSANIRSKNYVQVIPGEQYYFKKGNSAFTVSVYYYDAQKTFLRRIAQSWSYSAYTIPDGVHYIRFAWANTTYGNDISINYPSTDHDYHAYTGQQYTIDLDGTRYGGTLDVTNGVLTVTHGMVDLGTLTWTKSSSGDGKFYSSQATTPQYKTADNTDMVCSNYKFDGVGSGARGYFGDNGTLRYYHEGTSPAKELYVHDSAKDSMTAADFKTAMNGVTLVYEMETPLTVQLTETEVRTLLGQNNIFASTGDVEVTYRADMGLFIRKVIGGG